MGPDGERRLSGIQPLQEEEHGCIHVRAGEVPLRLLAQRALDRLARSAQASNAGAAVVAGGNVTSRGEGSR